MLRTQEFSTSLELDTPWGMLCFSGRVEHIDGRIEAITASFGGVDYARIESGAATDPTWWKHSTPSSRLAHALWPLLIAEIKRAHPDELATRYEAEPPRMAAA